MSANGDAPFALAGHGVSFWAYFSWSALTTDARIGSTALSHRNVWGRVFEEVKARPIGNQHLKHGLFQHWVFEPVLGEPVRIRRHLAIFERSRDRDHYERLKKYLFYYRLAFGQARQQDLLDKIVDHPDEKHLRGKLQACVINLSPFGEAHPWKKAKSEASDPHRQ